MSQSRALNLDILQLILDRSESEKGVLFNTLLLSKRLHLMTLPRLYRSNYFLDLAGASRFCRALHDHSHSPARFVQKLRMRIVQGPKKLFRKAEASEFVSLVHTTLPLMLNLQSLSVTGAEFEMGSSLSQLPFSLQSFDLLLPINALIWEFLQTQKSLKHLGLVSSRFRLVESDCLRPCREGITTEAMLPHLSSLISCPEIFATLAAGRPITHATLNRCQTHRRHGLMPILITGIDQSTGPLKYLEIDLGGVCDTSCMDFVLGLGETRAASALETLVLFTTSLDNEYWMPPGGERSDIPSPPPQLFSKLSALRLLIIRKPMRGPEDNIFNEELGELILPPEPGYDSIWCRADAKELWQAKCPRLTCVKIYDRKLDVGV